MSSWRIPLAVVAWLILVFLALPIIIVMLASISVKGDVSIPFGQVTLQNYRDFLGDEKWLRGAVASLTLAFASAAVSTVIATLSAVAVTRVSTLTRAVFDTAILFPLVLPHAAVALGLYSVVFAIGFLGSFPGVLLAHIVVTLPFAYRPVVTAMQKYDHALDEASQSLGATPTTTFWKVTVPVLLPGILSGFLFAFIISFDEATITMFLKGPSFSTLPVQIFSEIQEGSARIVPAISTFLIVSSVALVLIIKRLAGGDVFLSKASR